MSTKRTPWFPGDVRPAYPGVYVRELGIHLRDDFAKWDGRRWMSSRPTPDSADGEDVCVSGYQLTDEVRWRGLVSKPKSAPSPTAD